jgi:hypothetical protein
LFEEKTESGASKTTKTRAGGNSCFFFNLRFLLLPTFDLRECFWFALFFSVSPFASQLVCFLHDTSVFLFFSSICEKVDFRFKVGHDEKYNGPFEALAGWLRGKKTKNINGWILVGINGHLKYEEKVSTFTREDLKEAESIETVVSASSVKICPQKQTNVFFF